jgi:hypothetical protein
MELGANSRTGRAATGTTGNASVAVSDSGSWVLWFFAPSNWEVMVQGDRRLRAQP